MDEGRPWIGVDLDGTLAHYDEWRGIEHIGPPIEAMRLRVRQWLEEGQEVRILTARVGPQRQDVPHTIAEITRHIEQWCLTHLGQVLRVTSQKDYCMVEFWDDRCVQVVPNEGRSLMEELEELESKYTDMCTRLQECVQAHKLGLGGEKIDKLVCEALTETTAKLADAEKRLGEIAKLPEKWRAPGYFGTRQMLADELISALASPPDPSAEEVSRAEFEAACAQFDVSFTRDSSGNYGDSRSRVLFEVWMLACASKEADE